MDEDMLSVMGISGFGVKKNVRKLERNRFDKNKRPGLAPDEKPSLSGIPENVGKVASTSGQVVQEVKDSGPAHDSKTSPTQLQEPVYDPEAEELNGEHFDQATNDPLSNFPISHELILKDHNKVLSALAMDPSGARLISGSHDYDCKLWDFGGMDSRCKPFKSWEPAGCYYINDLKYSNKGDKFLVISGTSQAKLYERDGEEIQTFIKGDPYIRDMKNTSGHVADVSSCMWHPTESQLFITGSADSTIRVWDVENKRKQKTVIVVKSKERGARTKVTSCAYSGDGKVIAASCLDGALHIWNTSSNFVRPSMTIENAHRKETQVGSLVFATDARTILTRGGSGDETVKIWDMRNFRKPVLEKEGLAADYPGTNAIFSPDERYVVTGSGNLEKGRAGQLLFLRRDDLEEVANVELDSPAVKVLWHSRINQIVAGTASGTITVLFSPVSSTNGAKLIANKGPPRKATVESVSASLLEPTIVAPHALPMFRDGDDIITAMGSMATKRKREKERGDPRKSRRPELPVTGPGKGGRVGASATQHLVQTLFKDTTRDVDPREALLKYADQEDGLMWTKAWKDSGQVFAAEEEEKEEEEE